MPMIHNTFGELPPQPPRPPGPNYGPMPAVPPGGPAKRSRRWPALLVAGAIGAVVAATVAGLITAEVRSDHDGSAPQTTVTSTVAAPPPPSAAPLPVRQADQKTCRDGWVPAGNLARSAVTSLRRLPEGVRVDDPRIASNTEWAAAVQEAGNSYRRAGDVLSANITPGATPVLEESAEAAARALQFLGDAILASDPVNGNAGDIVDAAGAQVGALCQRLAR